MADFEIRLDVPLVCQNRSRSCWYAAACMVSYYREAGPRPGLKDVWDDNRRLMPDQIDRLIQAENLSVFPHPVTGRFSGPDLYAALLRVGPLWCGGKWYGNGHVIVLTGVDSNYVYFNDPEPMGEGTKDEREPISWFNDNLAWSMKNSILFRAF